MVTEVGNPRNEESRRLPWQLESGSRRSPTASGGVIDPRICAAWPTQQSHDVFNELSGSLDSLLAKYKKITETDLAAFNSLVKNMEIPAVIVKPKEPAR